MRSSISASFLCALACAGTTSRSTHEIAAQSEQAQSSDSNWAAVTGIVLEAKSRSPLSYAEVYLAIGTWYPPNTSYWARPDSSGHFRIDHISPGRYLLVVRRLAYEMKKRNWTARPGQTDTVEILLRPVQPSHCRGIECY